MAKYTVEATISSPPTRVGVTINKTTVLTMKRDADENWAGRKTAVSLPDSFDATLGAVGTTSAQFSVKIKVIDANGNQAADFKHDYTLNPSGIQIIHVSIQLTKTQA